MDKSIATKNYNEFKPEEIYEMAKYLTINKGHVSIGLSEIDTGDSIIHTFSNIPKNNLEKIKEAKRR